MEVSKAILTAEGEAGGGAVLIVEENMILEGVRRLKQLTNNPVVIREVEPEAIGGNTSSTDAPNEDSFRKLARDIRNEGGTLRFDEIEG